MKRYLRILGLVAMVFTATIVKAEGTDSTKVSKIEKALSRLHLGGYGEVALSRNFYSDQFDRYTKAEKYSNNESHGRFDIPHVTLNLGYDFGKGWSFGTEIEFEHGGNESAVEVDADESGEYEAEIEKGGEVALEQFWLNKRFWKGELNIRVGEIIVPVGGTNKCHMPTEFFTVYRPEGENALFPCTWHQVGVSAWGRAKSWGYEVQFLSGLDSERFGSKSFVHYGANSPYEFKIANSYAGVMRVDNYSVRGLRLSLSGYYGRTFANTLKKAGTKYDDVKGTLAIGSFDFCLNRFNWIIRGNADYAYLSDHAQITAFNKSFPTHTGQDGSPSKHQPVAKNAYSVGIEAGYDIFSQIHKTRAMGQKLYVFGRFEKYNSYAAGNQKSAYEWCDISRWAFGVNYYPIKQVVVKGEWSKRFLKSGFHNEPAINIGVAYAGWFL